MSAAQRPVNVLLLFADEDETWRVRLLNHLGSLKSAGRISLWTSSWKLSDEYFPLTRRQMKQSWRYLRCPIRQGTPAEVDIEATVDMVGRQGMLLAPVLVPRRINRVELVLLLVQ